MPTGEIQLASMMYFQCGGGLSGAALTKSVTNGAFSNCRVRGLPNTPAGAHAIFRAAITGDGFSRQAYIIKEWRCAAQQAGSTTTNPEQTHVYGGWDE